MSSRNYIKINPDFRFNKISLNKQTGFNSVNNLKDILYNFNDKHNIKRYNSESKQSKGNDKQLIKEVSKYKNELMGFINNKYDKNISINLYDKNMNYLRSKLLQNSNKWKKIDFNASNSNNKEILKLNINHYKYQKNIKNKGIQNNFKSYLSKNHDYNDIIHSNSEIVKNNKSYIKKNKLYLPYISNNIIRKRNNMKSLNIIIDFNNLRKRKNHTFEKRITTSNGNKNDRDIFKNINYFIDNKKSKINVNDIQRSISLNNDEEEDENENNKNKILNHRKLSEFIKKEEGNINKSNNEEDLIKLKEKEIFRIYEGTKKLIDTDKFYNLKNYRLAYIPNVSLDEGVKNTKEFESNVINMKNTTLDLPICIKLKKES